MNINNIDAFLKEVKPSLEKLARRRDTDIGFNAFALVSDTYYRENFHSDILAAILNPKGKHGEGTLFLDLFRKFLIGVAQRHGQSDLAAELEKLKIDDSIEVARESDGRIDVKIKGPDWVIIVENKINGACDQERQLPRYVENVESDGRYKVKAIVYLTAAQESNPARIEWKDGDEEMVNKLLIPVVGYTENSRVIDLVTGWLEPCELRAKAFNTRAVLSQYGELVRNQAGEIMSEKDIREVMVALGKSGLKYWDLRNLLEGVTSFIIGKVRARCEDGKSGIYWKCYYNESDSPGKSACVVCFEKIQLAIEVFCGPDEDWCIKCYREDSKKMDDFVPLLKDDFSKFKLQEPDRDEIKYCVDPQEVLCNVDDFLKTFNGFVDYVLAHRGEVKKILAKKRK